MYFEVSGVSKHKLGGMRDKWKIQAGYALRNTGYRKKNCAEYSTEQNVLVSTKKCGINLIFTGAIRDAG